jgi:hypothetical protein|tara:strand:- start:390 stop:551 length:162 start_codon:yes stop_codon:yes gene_type:complete
MANKEKIEQLKNEKRTLEEQCEFETNQARLAILEEEIYNIEHSIRILNGPELS